MGRAGFYLLLAALAGNVAVGHREHGHQTNANGALSEVARTPVGVFLLVAAAVGFAAFGIIRLAGAYSDRSTGRLRRLSTAGQALLYLAMAAATTSFVLGRRSTGSEQQQRSTAQHLVVLPAGRVLLAVIGVSVLGVCAWQVRVAWSGYYADSLESSGMSPAVTRLAALTGTIGIVARALSFAPIGCFLIVAAVTADPRQARGLDGLLLELTRHGWGRALVAFVAAGFVTFAVYTLVEARYRRVHAGH
ncbi:MAG: DUF1206 domain-containing protein [Pseudonocardiales bacterium]